MGMSDNGVTSQGDSGIMNLNIKTGEGMKAFRQPRKTKKLLDIIKSYEDEKKRAHLTKDELDFMNMIDEFTI